MSRSVQKHEAGRYRLVGPGILFTRAPGQVIDVQRPSRKVKGKWVYLDLEQPTVVELLEGDPLNVDFLRRAGVIEPLPPFPAIALEVTSGETGQP